MSENAEGTRRPLRLANVGTGLVVNWLVEAVEANDDIELVATYSRSLEHAREWGEPRGVHLFFDSLEELAASPDVDAVYVATPNALHMRQARILLEGGKHVLAEKPFATTREEAQANFDLARSKGVVLMEALVTLHTPGFRAVKEALAQIGEPRSASIRTGKVSSRVPALLRGELTRTFDPSFSGGGLMDMGVYVVEQMVGLFGAPERILAMGKTFDASTIGADPRYPLVDLGGEALCDYGTHIVNLSWSKDSDNHLPNTIQGTDATLVYEGGLGKGQLRLIKPAPSTGGYGTGAGVDTILEYEPSPIRFAGEVRDFVLACQGDPEALETLAWCEQVTLDSVSLMQEIRARMGVRYPDDER
ncbi:MAG: Gfo/Idh/MocA family oxidoreductase [Atopobiaceae bacterium]|nr:Gfo/Idh/MocA family oxidoreductase [Atopobiaceae bacterium]